MEEGSELDDRSPGEGREEGSMEELWADDSPKCDWGEVAALARMICGRKGVPVTLVDDVV